MARIALSVSSDYLPAWGVHEGLRELVQNYIDAAEDVNVPGEIRYEGGTARGRVFLRNPGAKPLTREALLFGVTSKANREDQRGQFGEGMKVGTLALVRAGRQVTIRTQTETWSASLSPAPDFGGRKVLTFDTRKRPTESDSVEIEIGPVERAEWDKIRDSFIFMQEEEAEVPSHKGVNGALLLDAAHRDSIFAKGIFVTKMDGCKWGYDLSSLALNRDRSMVDEWDVRYHIIRVLSEQVNKVVISIPDIAEMFYANTWETRSGSAWTYSDIPAKVIKHLASAKRLTAPLCRGIVLTASEDEATLTESYGYAAVRIPRSLFDAGYNYLTSANYEAFRKKAGITTYEDMVAEMKDAVETVWTREDLTDSEIRNLDWALGSLRRVDVDLTPKIVSFHRNDLLGLFKGGEIKVARSVLSDRMDVLGTLIHEYSHGWGADGTIQHTGKIEETWIKVGRAILAG